MKYRMTVTPARLAVGTLVANASRSFVVENGEAVDAELVKYVARNAEGIVHAAPEVPHALVSGASETHGVTVQKSGPLRIAAGLQFDWVFDVQDAVDARGGYGPLIYNGLIANAYHPEVGRGGYFHPNSGTSEGQGVMILACFLAYEALIQNAADEEVAEFYRELAITMLDAMGDGDWTGPMLRQPFPDDPETITLLHWLFAGKGAVELQDVLLDYPITIAGGAATVPAVDMGTGVSRVFQAYPANQELLYSSPYSPVVGGGSVAIESYSEDGAGNLHLVFPGGTADGSYKLVFARFSATTLPLGSAYEAYPAWTAIADGYSACAPDTFRWFDQALNKALQFGRPADAANWLKLRNGLRRTVVKGQDLSDLREVLKPAPLLGVFDVDGMFCYSDHPEALPPPAPLEQGWLGYNFFRRDKSTGDIVVTVPWAGTLYDFAFREVQIGRGVEDTWRGATTYQDPDQFLLLQIGVERTGAVGEYIESETFDLHISPFVSTTREYNENTRYIAQAPTNMDAPDLSSDGTVVTLLYPRSQFKALGVELAEGATILNFGVTFRCWSKYAYRVRIRHLRLVSGLSAEWVLGNLDAALQGSQLPYFPGAIPFATNADLKAQEFVGYNGNPFHGYQLPDLWLDLEAEAIAQHGTLTSSDLPAADIATGAITHPIGMTNANGTPKPTNVALMEQQCRFLQDAVAVYAADHPGINGPFAHTFVLNTPARHNIGSPTPHTWVYTNDDPNTRWVGYQVRVVESLAQLVYRTTGRADCQDVRAMALTMVVDWLAWLDAAWPNLDGILVEGTLIRGMPTDYGATGAPETLYEETHAPAIVLRACAYLKLAEPGQATLCDTLMLRCWDYLELNWRTAGEMRYTWSPDPEARQWYGFWHGEILWTLSQLLLDCAPARPTAILEETVRERLRLTKLWLDEVGVVDARHRLIVAVDGLRAAPLDVTPNWSEPFNVSMEFKTEILTSQSGREQRIALRSTPRKTLEYAAQLVGAQLRAVQTRLATWQNRPWVVAEYTRSVTLLEALAPESDHAQVDEVPVWLTAGAVVMLRWWADVEACVVEQVRGNRVYFAWPSGRAWPAGSALCHAVAGDLQTAFSMPRLTDRAGTMSVSLDVAPGSETYAPAEPDQTYRGIELFALRKNWTETPTTGHEWAFSRVDYGRGLIGHVRDVEHGVRQETGVYLAGSRAEARLIEDFFLRLAGCQGSYWMPTWEDDLPAVAGIVAGSSTLLTSNTEAALLLDDGAYQDIAIITADLRILPNRVASITTGASSSVIVLEEPWPESLALGEILAVCWLPLWRLASDALTFSWLTDEICQVSITHQTDPTPEDS
ncbi:hypothetical protein [Azotobacter chroococcum]|uniref:Uncharacterized protein n=1 Tax=Azotobacter chroococcum TaxID=353 RepID=A0AAP9YF95_9GAMM|nr:hypothetical protein [Azotobacter chroococcum]QQE90275.1 hypothetical protein GKQ51_08275 [Azotobacter chroococcum]